MDSQCNNNISDNNNNNIMMGDKNKKWIKVSTLNERVCVCVFKRKMVRWMLPTLPKKRQNKRDIEDAVSVIGEAEVMVQWRL